MRATDALPAAGRTSQEEEDMETDYCRLADVGGAIVHATILMGGGLHIHATDPPSTAHILTIPRTKESLLIVGWLYAGEARSRGVWEDELGLYVVPPWRLHEPRSAPIQQEPGYHPDIRVWRPSASPGPGR
jgi:hypothetical protein